MHRILFALILAAYLLTLEKAGPGLDPNGAAAPAREAGPGLDPSGVAAPARATEEGPGLDPSGRS